MRVSGTPVTAVSPPPNRQRPAKLLGFTASARIANDETKSPPMSVRSSKSATATSSPARQLPGSYRAMTINEATRSYERWMRRCGTLIEAELREKHARMRRDLFLFFRGTFYRWTQLWRERADELSAAPHVLAVGDLHIGSFGTWRDGEGRLAWGVDDFDEAHPLPYTQDLVRLATSVKLGIDADQLSVGLREGCDAILDGYANALRAGGCPLVLAEAHQNMRQFGFEALKPPKRFWRHLKRLPRARQVPRDVTHAFRDALPRSDVPYQVLRRRAGMGSLGQPRFVALAEWEGGCIAREAKALIPSAIAWLAGQPSRGQPYYQRILADAIRSRDPFQLVVGRWLIRRLSPEANPIDLTDLPKERDEVQLLRAMGTETANVHLAAFRQRRAVLDDLARRPSKWLRDAAKTFAKAVEQDWNDYRA